MFVDQLDTLFGFYRSFKQIQGGVDVAPLQQELFDEEGKLKFATQSRWPHHEAGHIQLRSMVPVPHGSKLYYGTVTESMDTQLYPHYPCIRAWVEEFAATHNARLERVLIAALPARARIHAHADRGFYHAPRDRYHLVLQSDGSYMKSAGQDVFMKEGDVWWLNNKARHESWNDSGHARIHLIFDLYPNSLWKRVANYIYWVYLGLRPNRLSVYYINWPRTKQTSS